ncbi:MAG: o-succinylbenzoate--CoA ligase [Kineosporiaceae bacterium]
MTAGARPVRGLPVTTTGEDVTALLAALRAALRGDGPAPAPHPSDRGPAPAAGAGHPLGDGEDEDSDPTAAVVATSGSTGEPKAALLPASALLASAAATHDRLGGPGTWLLAVPPHTVAGVLVAVRCLTAGTEPGVCDLRGGFSPDRFAVAAGALRGHRRYTALVAAQVRRVLDAGGPALAALAALDAVLLGGGPVPGGMREDARRAGVRLVATYGSSETSGGCVYDGRPLDGVVVDTTPDGRVRVAGPVVARGYRARPGHPAFDDSPWGRRFTTDDLGALTDGVVTVEGRVDDVVVSGGYKVSVHLVADVLRARPGVRDAAVVGVPDREWGTRLAAAVVAAPGTRLDPVRLRRDVAAELGRWAAPDVVVVDELPTTGPGKTDRGAVRRLVTARMRPRPPAPGPEGAR